MDDGYVISELQFFNGKTLIQETSNYFHAHHHIEFIDQQKTVDVLLAEHRNQHILYF